MWSYDQETRRQMCRERIDQMARDARAPITGRRRRRWAEIARRIAMSPAAYRSRRPSYGS